MRPRRIEVEVRELELDGLSARDRAAVVDALHRDLPAALRAWANTPVRGRTVENAIGKVLAARLRR